MPIRHLTVRLIAGAAIAGTLGACTQSSAPPAQASASPPQAASTPAPAAPPAAPAATQQNATLSEILSSSQPVAANSAAAPNSGTAPNAGPAAEVARDTQAAGASVPADAAADGAEYATVVNVKKIEGPQQVCHDETVVEKRPQEDKHKVAGTAIGAIVGGVLGNQIGGGRGRTVATVGGAVAGGAIGHKVQENHQNKDTVTRVVKRCHPVSAEEAGKPLYDIVYSYQGQTYQARLDYDPGDRIELPVRSVE